MKSSLLLINTLVVELRVKAFNVQALTDGFWNSPGGFMQRREKKAIVPAGAQAPPATGPKMTFDVAQCPVTCEWDKVGLLWLPKTLPQSWSAVEGAEYVQTREGGAVSQWYDDVVCSAMTTENTGHPLLSCTFCTLACVRGDQNILGRAYLQGTIGTYCACEAKDATNPGALWHAQAKADVDGYAAMAGQLTEYAI